MKTLFKYASGLFLTGMLSVLMVAPANAQRGATHGGSGGIRIGGGGSIGGGFRGSNLGIARPATGVNVRGSSSSFAGVRPNSAAVGYRGRTGGSLGGSTGYHSGAFYRTGLGYCGYPHIGFYL